MQKIRTDQPNFGFGIEAEFPLVTLSGDPVWYSDVSFETLYSLFESLSLEGLSSRDGLKLESPHRKALPFVVEGYHLPHPLRDPETILPKGVEIRTPLASTLGDCMADFEILFERLQKGLGSLGLAATFLSHHPTADGFSGPQNKRREDYWRWAMEAMHTYGPDINVSLPRDLEVDCEDLDQKVNAYAPALTALSLNSPFFQGKLWEAEGQGGLAYRTFRRSVIAPAIELHPDQKGRLEYKTFEMSPYLRDYEGYFLLWLTLLLDDSLGRRAGAPERIYGLGRVAVEGLRAPGVRETLGDVFAAAHRVLPRWGFDPAGLAGLEGVLERGRTPAQECIDDFHHLGSLQATLLKRTQFWERKKGLGVEMAFTG